jgi:hypothetical protein
MRNHLDEALAEVRNARKSLCDRFGNNPRELLAHQRAEQRSYHGRIIKHWSELKPAAALHEKPVGKKVK